MVSVTGSNLLQNIKESLQLPPEYEIIHNPETGKDEVGFIMFFTLLQNIKEFLQLPPEYEIIHNPETCKDEVGSIYILIPSYKTSRSPSSSLASMKSSKIQRLARMRLVP